MHSEQRFRCNGGCLNADTHAPTPAVHPLGDRSGLGPVAHSLRVRGVHMWEPVTGSVAACMPL